MIRTQPPRQPAELPPLSDRQVLALKVPPERWRAVAQRLEGWKFRYNHTKPLFAGASLWFDCWSDGIAVVDKSDAAAVRVDPLGCDRRAKSGMLSEVLDALDEPPPTVVSHTWPVRPRTTGLLLPGQRTGSRA